MTLICLAGESQRRQPYLPLNGLANTRVSSGQSPLNPDKPGWEIQRPSAKFGACLRSLCLLSVVVQHIFVQSQIAISSLCRPFPSLFLQQHCSLPPRIYLHPHPHAPPNLLSLRLQLSIGKPRPSFPPPKLKPSPSPSPLNQPTTSTYYNCNVE